MAFDGLGFKHFCAESVKAAVLDIAISVTYDDIYPVRVPHNDSVRVRFAEAAEVRHADEWMKAFEHNKVNRNGWGTAVHSRIKNHGVYVARLQCRRIRTQPTVDYMYSYSTHRQSCPLAM